MRLLGPVLLTILLAAPASGAEPPPAPAPPPLPQPLPKTVWPSIELTDGRVFQQARATSADPLSVTFAHREGITKVDRRLLPAELASVFPFDAAEAGRAAQKQAAERAASAEEQKTREEEAKRSAARSAKAASAATRKRPAATTSPAAATPNQLCAAVRARAQRYFEDEKRTGSGATLVFSVNTELEDPEPVSGWADRWEIEGVASYKVYDSVGWGSFSSRTRKFRALVEAPPGKTPKVVGLDER
jgi:hypothetical protein